jgi:hypothetical protein
MIGNGKARYFLLLAAWLVSVLFVVTGRPIWAIADARARILVLPFDVADGDRNGDLGDFREHADNQIRTALRLIGESIAVVGTNETGKLLATRKGPTTDKEATRMAEESGADLVIYGSVSHKGKVYRMQGLMRDVKRGRVSVSTDIKVRNRFSLLDALATFIGHVSRRIHGSPKLPLYKVEPPAAANRENLPRLRPIRTHPSPRPRQNLGPWRSPYTKGELRAIDIGDLDGDGKNETIFLHDHGLTISRFEGGSLKTLAEYSERPAVFFSAEVEDIDKDGISELLLSYRKPSGIESSLIRYVNRNFEVIKKFPNMILGTVPDPNDNRERRLVGQRTDVKNIFSGEMVLYRMDGPRPVANGTIMLPPGTLLLSFAAGRLGNPAVPLRIILNQDQRLMVFDEENHLLYTLPDRIFGLDRHIRLRSGSEKRDIVFPGRLLIADTAGDGENELLVIKQRGRHSLIQALTWDGSRLKPDWHSVENNAVISDFRIRDFKNGGVKSLVLLLVRYSFLAGPYSQIFAYDLAR